MMARPTAASAAATAMTKNTKTCPPNPRLCASATNVRFTALSMSSTHMKMMITLRRNSTPATPSTNSTAEIASAGLRSILELSLRQDDGAHDRSEEQHAGDLEGNEVGVEQRIGDGADDALMILQPLDGAGRQLDRRREGRLSDRLQQQQERTRQDRGGQERGRPSDIRRSRATQVEQHDHEQEQHHDRAGVHQDLEHGDELRVEQYEEGGQREQRDDEPERAGDGVPARDAEQRARDRDAAKDPEERDRHYSPFGSDGSHSV